MSSITFPKKIAAAVFAFCALLAVTYAQQATMAPTAMNVSATKSDFSVSFVYANNTGNPIDVHFFGTSSVPYQLPPSVKLSLPYFSADGPAQPKTDASGVPYITVPNGVTVTATVKGDMSYAAIVAGTQVQGTIASSAAGDSNASAYRMQQKEY